MTAASQSGHVDRLAAIAVALAARVGDRDPADNAAWLLERLPDPADWFRLCFVQALANDPNTWHDSVRWAREGVKLRVVDEDTLPYEAWQILEHPRPANVAAGIDEVKVDRFCSGERGLTLNRAERREVVRILTGRGWTAEQIGDVLGIERSAVARGRHRDARRAREAAEEAAA